MRPDKRERDRAIEHETSLDETRLVKTRGGR